jgi:hypothetical protein
MMVNNKASSASHDFILARMGSGRQAVELKNPTPPKTYIQLQLPAVNAKAHFE